MSCRAKSCLPWYSSRSMSPSGFGSGGEALGEGPAVRCYIKAIALRLVAAGLRPGRLARALAILLLFGRAGVLQLDADEVVRDRVAVADVEPPPRREVLVQPPEADRERDAHDHLVHEEPEDAVRRRDPVAGDQVDDRAVDDADDRPRDRPQHRRP